MIDLDKYGVTKVGECVGPGCSLELIARAKWYGLTDTERAELAAAGFARSQARGLCSTCYERAKRSGHLEQYARLQRPAGTMAEDYDHIRDQLPVGVSRAERLRRAAPRLGMTANALDVALRRAGVAA